MAASCQEGIVNNWHHKVYGKTRKGISKTVTREVWRALRKSVLIRDRYTCYRCGKKSRSAHGLSAHHIIPRLDGGLDDLDNLVILCHPCHDFVEIEGFRSLGEIADSRDVEVPKKKVIVFTREEAFERPSWHRYVYGGERNPNV